jgi:hypothetical protein
MDFDAKMKYDLPQKRSKMGGMKTITWGLHDKTSNAADIFKPVASKGMITNELQNQVVIDAYSEADMTNYYKNFESFFETTKEKRKVEPVRLSINPVNAVCRYTKDSILVNGIHEKQEGSFEVDLSTLAVKQQVNKHVVSDMAVVAGYLIVAMPKPKTADGVQGSQVMIYSLDSTKQGSAFYTAQTATQATFYENFFPKTRIFATSARSTNIAYIGQGDKLVVLSIRGSGVFEYPPLHLPKVNHATMVKAVVRCLTSDGLLHTVVLQEGSFSRGSSVQIGLDTPAQGSRFFTCIGSNVRYSVVSCINKDLKNIELCLILNGRNTLVDKLEYKEEKKIFPVNQIQLLQKGPFTNVITTELYERFSFYIIKQNKLIPLNERERFTMELIYGINFYDQQKAVTSVIYGNSFFKKVSL